MTNKQKIVFTVVAVVIVLGIILSYVCYHFIYGTRITSREGDVYKRQELQHNNDSQSQIAPQISKEDEND